MIKVRITPLLRTFGFKEGDSHGIYVSKNGQYYARIYKLSAHVRALEIVKTVYINGEKHHKELVVKDLPLDADDSRYDFYMDVLMDLGREFGRPRVVENAEYYFNWSPEKKVNDRE